MGINDRRLGILGKTKWQCYIEWPGYTVKGVYRHGRYHTQPEFLGWNGKLGVFCVIVSQPSVAEADSAFDMKVKEAVELDWLLIHSTKTIELFRSVASVYVKITTCVRQQSRRPRDSDRKRKM